MSGVILGTAVLAGGAAGTGAFFLGKKKKPEKLLEGGQIAGRAKRPFESVTETPVGKSLNERILAGLKGEGVGPSQIGFGPGFVDKTTSPLVAQREARFRRVERPAAEASFGARGLARSTIAGREIGEITGQKERDINETIAQATLLNEQQKKVDEQQRFIQQNRVQELSLKFADLERITKAGASATDIQLLQNDINNRLIDMNIEAGAQEDARQNRLSAVRTGASVFGGVAGGGGGIGSAVGGAQGLGGGGQQGGGTSSADLATLAQFLRQNQSSQRPQPFTSASSGGGTTSFGSAIAKGEK